MTLRIVPLSISPDGNYLEIACAELSPDARTRVERALGRTFIAAPRSRPSSRAEVFAHDVPADALDALLLEAYQLLDADPSAVTHVSRSMALKHHVLPLRVEGERLFVGFVRSPSDELLRMLSREAKGLEIVPVVLPSDALHATQKAAYRLDAAAAGPGAGTRSSPLARGEAYVFRAVRDGADDVHFESTETGGRVRLNNGGDYAVLDELGPEDFRQVVGALRGSASIDAGNDLEAVVGTRTIAYENRRVELRLVTAPTVAHAEGETGLQLVVRLHDVDAAPRRYRDLGMRKDLARVVRAAFRLRKGVTIVVGPPDSGKNTLATAMIDDLPRDRMKVCTAESPVERRLEYVQHHEVSVHNTYEKLSARLMQLNTQLLYQAECLDAPSAKAIATIGNFGLGAITTMHVKNCKGAIRRALHLGIDRADLAEFANMFIAQRLVRVVCRHCCKRVDPPAFVRERRPEFKGQIQQANPVGCDVCAAGYTRKTGVFEVMIVTDAMRQAIAAGASADDVEQLALERPELGYRPLLEDALDRLIDGTTTFDELAKALDLGDAFLSACADEDDSWWAA